MLLSLQQDRLHMLSKVAENLKYLRLNKYCTLAVTDWSLWCHFKKQNVSVLANGSLVSCRALKVCFAFGSCANTNRYVN